MCLVISKLWNERDKNINSDYAMTGWMLLTTPHIREDVFKNPKVKHYIQVNNVIKTLYAGSSEKEFYETLDTFWSEYKKFNNNNDPFESNEFIWSSKYIRDGNSHMWHQK